MKFVNARTKHITTKTAKTSFCVFDVGWSFIGHRMNIPPRPRMPTNRTNARQ